MNVRSIRRLTNDSNHNAFTGACWFRGILYVAFRQGDAHAEQQGRLIVMRSRDEGISFDTVHVARGQGDTRDAHLYTDGKRLYLVGFVTDPRYKRCSGTSWTEDGLVWSTWTPFKGADGFVMWRPQWHAGRYYCGGYNYASPGYGAAWFESSDGIRWRKIRWLRKGGADKPNECALAFKPDGTAAVLMRREHQGHRPLLLRSRPPYRRWTVKELDVPLCGPSVWWVGDDLWIAGRWLPRPQVAHLALFQIVDDKPRFEMVMPSGPAFDCSYMGVAPHPTQRGRFFFSYYSNHVAPDDPSVSQWHHPDIYLADVQFSADFIQHWKVSDLQRGKTLDDAVCPGNGELKGWHAEQCLPADHIAAGFVSVKPIIDRQPGLVYLVSDLEVGPCDGATLYLGYDGPIRVWVNGRDVFKGAGTNPAVPDKTVLAVPFRHGRNRLAIALDSNGGRACGIFARYDAVTATGK